ncbi:uncharacterized protein LOC116192910 [Punica granatum]|uniref:Uncharacterized protein n=2 Tax=Punica granatum TaxID=22663 RepID=A0A218WJ30_PUNGR|nr:uncharacterized protein LOC116192910 [Punica granatum]OWM72042.1 hypothetical protein CDL15_Pgr017925 [Punica granatum]PKI53992.1 hypothetical protein CRG98_025603 [Punica granatum]
MAKKRGNQNRGPTGAPVSLREEATGLKPTATKSGAAEHTKSVLKLQHLRKLAVWAAGEGSVPSLGAFFGRRLAAVGESSGEPPDPSLFSCQRCETILQPGYSCTIRLEKNRASARRRCKKPRTPPQNNVVYTCHFCLHRNLKRGTPKGHMKDLYPPKSTAQPKPKPLKSTVQMPCNSGLEIGAVDEISRTEIGSPVVKGEVESPVTPSTKLLDSKRRKRNRSGSKKVAEAESRGAESSVTATSSKRRRNNWNSLKKIAESCEHNRNIANLKIPLFM